MPLTEMVGHLEIVVGAVVVTTAPTDVVVACTDAG